MVNYNNGKIYRLVCNSSGKQYIGSTANPLYKRKSEHKKGYTMWLEGRHNYVSSYEIVKGGNYDIFLIESFPCNNRNELDARERYWIENMECVNLLIPTRTLQERPSYEEFKKKAVERARKWNEDNREHRKEYLREYTQANKEKRAEKITCNCGSEVRKGGVWKHRQSQKHKDWEENQNA